MLQETVFQALQNMETKGTLRNLRKRLPHADIDRWCDYLLPTPMGFLEEKDGNAREHVGSKRNFLTKGVFLGIGGWGGESGFT